jgi:alpha-mannosidase
VTNGSTTKLTKSEQTILTYYKQLTKQSDKFCLRLEKIARTLGIDEKTVRRANTHFRELGWLFWIAGSKGQANQYWLRTDILPSTQECPTLT